MVTSCADCYHGFKHLYPKLGSKVEVLHTVEVIDQLIREGKLKFTKTIPLTVTYHDPCHSGRHGEPYIPWEGVEKKIRNQIVVYEPRRPRYNGAWGVYDPPRNLLKSIPGIVPAYKAMLPDNFRAYTLAFPTWRAWADCCHKIWDAGIGYIAHRQFNFLGRELKGAMVRILSDPTKTLYDIEALLDDPEIQKMTEEMKRDFQIVLAGMTPRNLEWQEKALDTILTETGGWKVAAMNEPDIEKWTLLYLIRLGHKNLNLVYGGGYDGCFGLVGPPDFGTPHVEKVAEFKAAWEKKGPIVDAGGDCMIGGIGGLGGGGMCMWENFAHFDPYDKESTEGTFDFFEACFKFVLENRLPPGMERWNAVARGADGRETPKEEQPSLGFVSLKSQQRLNHTFEKSKERQRPSEKCSIDEETGNLQKEFQLYGFT